MNKKEAIKEYKSKKLARGIYAIRCVASGEVWVDSSKDLGSAKNSQWFALKQSHRNPAIQAAWNEHGEDTFQFEVLETLDEDFPDIGLHDELKNRKQHWITELRGAKLY
jgi:hypothetical protein